VGRFFPSTKLCSECGYKNDSLSLSDREWTCPECATHHIRDFNSAKNVRSEGLKIVAAGYRRR
jgi:putative transposase